MTRRLIITVLVISVGGEEAGPSMIHGVIDGDLSMKALHSRGPDCPRAPHSTCKLPVGVFYNVSSGLPTSKIVGESAATTMTVEKTTRPLTTFEDAAQNAAQNRSLANTKR